MAAVASFVFYALGAITVASVRAVMVVTLVKIALTEVSVGNECLSAICTHSNGESNFVAITDNPLLTARPTSWLIDIVLAAVRLECAERRLALRF